MHTGELRHMKNIRKWIWVYAIIAFIVVSVGLLVAVALESNRLRHFKTDLFVLCTESDICVADGPDGRVRVNSANWSALYSVVEKTHGNLSLAGNKVKDTVTFNFDCHDEQWIFTVDLINENKMIITLNGPRNYVVHVNNQGAFDSFLKAASIESFNTRNKPF
jgi:hypothetical protein